jgi:hypothetical protein
MRFELACLLIAWLPVPVLGQIDLAAPEQATPPDSSTTTEARRDAEPGASAPAVPDEGLWPSKKLMRSMLLRWADEASRQYDLDDRQRSRVREAIVERWESYLTEHRADIQPVVNEFIEMRMDIEPPGQEQVQAWAERAVPVFEEAREQISAGTEEFREILEPRQRAKFELDTLKLGVGLQAARQKLEQWRGGTFDADEFWEPTPSVRHQRREERRRRRAEAAAKVPPTSADAEQNDQISLELAAWDRYVGEFARIFDLDEGQRTTVLSVLTELKNRAKAHGDRRRAEIAELEERIATFEGTEEEATELKKQLTELYGPVDDMFQELKSRIESVPTARQRAEAALEKEGDKKDEDGRTSDE